MFKYVLTLFVMMLTSFNSAYCIENVSEKGIEVNSKVTAVAETKDGILIVITKNNELIKIYANGKQEKFNLDLKDKKSKSYFSDIEISGSRFVICNYDYPALFVGSLDKPSQLVKIPIEGFVIPVKPMTVSAGLNSYFVKDAEDRTFKVLAASNKITLMPPNTQVIPDIDSPIIIPPAEFKDGKTVFKGIVYNEKKQPIWKAPKALEPEQVLDVSFLGTDKDKRYVYLVKSAKGELDEKYTVYAVKNNRIIAKRIIPQPSDLSVMRYCKLSYNGYLIVVLPNSKNENGVTIRRLNLDFKKEKSAG